MSVSDMHAWFPSSPCGARCITAVDASVSRLWQWARIARLIAFAVAVILPSAPVIALLPRAARRVYLRWMSRRILGALGIVVDVDDRRSTATATGLLVSNHTSFLDVFAIASAVPSQFVAKSDVMKLPVIGTVARRVGVITVDRGRLRELPGTIDAMATALDHANAVCVFPEGTTWCGRASGTFRPAPFQAAIDSGIAVTPIRVTFTDAAGRLHTAASFVGDDEILDTLRRIVAVPELTVNVTIYPQQVPAGDRRELAKRCERVVFRSLPVAELPAFDVDHVQIAS